MPYQALGQGKKKIVKTSLIVWMCPPKFMGWKLIPNSEV
jgi:hypothetical protein